MEKIFYNYIACQTDFRGGDRSECVEITHSAPVPSHVAVVAAVFIAGVFPGDAIALEQTTVT